MKFRPSCFPEYVFMLLFTLVAIVPLRLAKGQCAMPQATFVSRSGSTSVTRYGYLGYTMDANGYPQYFHQYHETETVDNSSNPYQNWTATINSDTKTQLDPLTDVETTNITGTLQIDSYNPGIGENHIYGLATNIDDVTIPRCLWWEYEVTTVYPNPATYYTNPDLDAVSCGSGMGWITPYFCTDGIGATYSTNGSVITQDFEGDPGDGSSRSDVLVMSWENKFGPKELSAAVSVGSPVTNSSAGYASFQMTGNDSISFSALLSRFDYQLAIPNSVRGATYTCSYQKNTIITDAGGNTVTNASVPLTGLVVGTGDPVNPALGGVLHENVPSDPGTSISVTSPVVIDVKMPDSNPNPPPGSGGP